MINVLIVEDDPMVAEFNKRYLEQVDGFLLVDIANCVKEALDVIEEKNVDLLLLDVFMPGENGLSLLRKVREEKQDIDAILITAASDVEKIQEALRNGAVDYLIKPFEFDRFEQALRTYREQHVYLKRQRTINQEDLDQLLLVKEEDNDQGILKPLPKGLSRKTLVTVLEAVKKQGKAPFSTDVIAEVTEISRVSVRKYLKFLNDIGVIDETLTYGIGRPLYSYIYNADKQYLLDGYE
ncbi:MULTISPECIES: response regulator [Metabacillus]|uniref:Response regulator n=1 Tax=Metabacillus endolithicus TaxID=1535204 RepID=A0ABW5C4C0_9BACI|nr:response regulator [Metabacillus endolithicus]UPG65919.1 response regulator [Metabacillus endolithicus]